MCNSLLGPAIYDIELDVVLFFPSIFWSSLVSTIIWTL